MGDLKGDRKNYAPYILMLSAEKLALIGLTELMKVNKNSLFIIYIYLYFLGNNETSLEKRSR